jgi:signal recognition particle subunit SRP54
MFESLSDRLEGIFKKLKGKGFLKEEEVNAAMKEIRMAQHNPWTAGSKDRE